MSERTGTENLIIQTEVQSIGNPLQPEAVAGGGLRAMLHRRRDLCRVAQVPTGSILVIPDETASQERDSPEIQYGFEMTDESKSFWEQGDIEPSKSFYDLVADVRNGKDERPRVLQASESAILSDSIKRSKLHFTEAEAVLDLADYLSFTSVAAEKAGNAEMVATLAAFQEQFSFLGTKEYEAATAGIAQAWLDYLKKSPNHILNIWTGYDERRRVKSQTAVSRDIIKKFNALEAAQGYAKQLRIEPKTWSDSSGAKLVVVDDYIATGVSARENIARAHTAAKQHNAKYLVDKTEVHILIGKEDQRQITDAQGKSLPVRSFFRSIHSPNPHVLNFSSAHSSMDSGFEQVFEQTAIFLHEQKIVREQPLLAYLERSYYEGFATTSKGQALLQDVVEARQQAVSADQARSVHELQIRKRGDDYLADWQRVSLLDEANQIKWRLAQRAQDAQDEEAMSGIIASITAANTNLNLAKSSYRN